MSVTRVVQIKLPDPSQAEALCARAREVFPTIPGVTSFWAGTASGGAEAVYLVGFEDMAAAEAYVPDPIHQNFKATEMQPRGAQVVAQNFQGS